MNFNVSGTKNVAIAGLQMKDNRSLQEALHQLIRGLPETSEVSVTVDGSLADDNKDHKLTITVSTVHRDRDLTQEEVRNRERGTTYDPSVPVTRGPVIR